MTFIKLVNIKIQNKKVEYEFNISDDLKRYFNLDEPFFIEYSEDIANVPKSILVIPFLCNVLPIAWICNAEIIVDEIDKDFYESIVAFKQGYIDMYPNIDLKGSLKVGNIIDNSYKTEEKFAAFFSGGVDSFSTLITHIKENLTLITLWGSDIKLNDSEGWQNVKSHAEETAKQFGLKNLFVKSSFRLFIYEGELDKLVGKAAGDMWWHGFQHGIGLIGHAAPYAYNHRLKTVYVPSTYSNKSLAFINHQIITCASFPTIDNNVKLASANVYHDGWDYTRQDKIHNITEFAENKNLNLALRVCWISTGGNNCCKCEKCYRTIYGILAEGKDPKNFGFPVVDLIQSKKDIKFKITIQNLEYWNEIQAKFKDNLNIVASKDLKWIYNIDFNKVNEYPPKRLFLFVKKVYYKIKELCNFKT